MKASITHHSKGDSGQSLHYIKNLKFTKLQIKSQEKVVRAGNADLMICKDLVPDRNPIKLLFTSYVKSHLQLFIHFCRALWFCGLMHHVLDREVSAPNLVEVFNSFRQDEKCKKSYNG